MSTQPPRPEFTQATVVKASDGALKPTAEMAAEENPKPDALLTIAPRYRTVGVGRRASYDFLDDSVFTVDVPLAPFDWPVSWGYEDKKPGVFIKVSDGKTGQAYVFISRSKMEAFMGLDDVKAKVMVAFADRNYETFAKIVADLNEARSVIAYKPFAKCSDAVVSNEGDTVRVYLFEYAV